MFTSDEKGIVEPGSDLVVMMLAVTGFVIFIAVAMHMYGIYQEKTYIAQHYNDASSLAQLLKTDPLFTITSRPDLIDISKLELLTQQDAEDLKQHYSTSYDFAFKFEAQPSYNKVVGTSPDMGVSACVPVTIRLNEVQEIPGTLTVKIWEK